MDINKIISASAQPPLLTNNKNWTVLLQAAISSHPSSATDTVLAYHCPHTEQTSNLPIALEPFLILPGP